MLALICVYSLLEPSKELGLCRIALQVHHEVSSWHVDYQILPPGLLTIAPTGAGALPASAQFQKQPRRLCRCMAHPHADCEIQGPADALNLSGRIQSFMRNTMEN